MIHLAILLAAMQANAAPRTAAPPVVTTRSPDGAWDGGMTVPAGLVIPFQLDLAGGGGRFAAPDMKARDVPVTVTTEGSRVVVTLPRGSARFEAMLSADGATLSGTWVQGSQSFPARFARRGTGGAPTARVRPQTPVAPTPYEARDVVIPAAGGVVLGATLTRPAAKGPLPAVLLIGGNGPQNRDEAYAGHRPMLLVADRLTRAGSAVLRYDKRGVGASTGRYASATGANLVSDARSALAWLRAQPGVDAGRVCVLGLSEGAIIAPIVAAQDDPACTVLLSPPGVPSAALLGEQARLAALDVGKPPEVAARDGAITKAIVQGMARAEPATARMKLALAAGATSAQAIAAVRELESPEVRTFLSDDPAIALRKLGMPVLVLVGSRDHQVAPALNLPPVRAALARNRAARFVVLPGLNHVLQPADTGAVGEYATIDVTMDEKALAEIVAFIARSVRPSTLERSFE